MEKITYDEILNHNFNGHNNDNFLGWAIMCLVSQNNHKLVPHPERIFEVELKIDGNEISLRDLIKRMEDEYNHQVKHAAYELMKEKLDNLSNAMYEMETTATRITKRILDVYKDEY